MKRKNVFMAALACALALCLALAGCDTATVDPEADYVGYWTFSEGTVDGESMDDLVDTMESFDLHFILSLETGGTGQIDIFGEVSDIEWDASAQTITVDGEEETLTLGDGEVRIEEGDDYFAFTKSDEDLSDTIEQDQETYESLTSGDYSLVEEDIEDLEGEDQDAGEAGTSEAIDPVITVADDDVCTITITEKAVDEWDEAGYTVEMVNKTDDSIEIMIPADVTSVDGTMDELYGSATLLAGTNATDFFYFFDVDSIDGLTNVQTTFEVVDPDTYDTLASYTVTIP